MSRPPPRRRPPACPWSGAATATRSSRACSPLGAVGIPVLLGLPGAASSGSAPGSRSAKFGLDFVTTSVWDPVAEQFGALPAHLRHPGLVAPRPGHRRAALARRGDLPHRVRAQAIRQPVAFLIELLAAIPSVVYGLWGIFVLIPLLRKTRLPAAPRRVRLPALLPGPDLRPVDARGRHHPRDHGHAVHHVGLPRGAAGGAATPSARRRWRSAPRAGRR